MHLPAEIPFINGLLKKRGLQDLVGYCYIKHGNDLTVKHARRPQGDHLHLRHPRRHLDRRRRHGDPAAKREILDQARTEVVEIENQRSAGVITAGERHNKIIDIWHRATERVSEEMFREMRAIEQRARRVQPDLHDGRLRRPRLPRAGAPARRHARPDVEALGRGHRDADHRQLPRGAVGARVLHLDPRRPQGSRRHRAQDRRLRLPDAASGRRRPGRHHHRARLRHHRRHLRVGDHGGRRHPRAAARPHRRPRRPGGDLRPDDRRAAGRRSARRSPRSSPARSRRPASSG